MTSRKKFNQIASWMQKKTIKTHKSLCLVTSINVIFTTGTVYILSWVLFKAEKGSRKITVIFLAKVYA